MNVFAPIMWANQVFLLHFSAIDARYFNIRIVLLSVALLYPLCGPFAGFFAQLLRRIYFIDRHYVKQISRHNDKQKTTRQINIAPFVFVSILRAHKSGTGGHWYANPAAGAFAKWILAREWNGIGNTITSFSAQELMAIWLCVDQSRYRSNVAAVVLAIWALC